MNTNVLLTLILVELFAGCFYLWVFRQLRALRKAPSLNLNVNARPCSSNDVTVVVAARNEADNLAQCVKSIVNQDSVQKVIIVDDHSTDRTLQVAEKLASTHPQVAVFSAPDLPAGWTGKSHAMQAGSRHAASKYILFTDADVNMKPGIIAAAWKEMEQRQLDHLSGQFFLKCGTIFEQICAPAFAASSTIALFSAAPEKGSATGAFNMVRSKFYRQCGEHDRIKASVIDDVELAGHLKTCGGKTSYVFLADAIAVRLFMGISGFFRVIYRAALPYLRMRKAASFWKALAFLIVGLATGLPCAMCLFPQPPGLRIETSGFIALTIFTYLLGFSCACETKRYHDGHSTWLLFYPLGMIVMAVAIMYAVACSSAGRSISWRGRYYNPV